MESKAACEMEPPRARHSLREHCFVQYGVTSSMTKPRPFSFEVRALFELGAHVLGLGWHQESLSNFPVSELLIGLGLQTCKTVRVHDPQRMLPQSSIVCNIKDRLFCREPAHTGPPYIGREGRGQFKAC